ncbi:NUDIX hydrolase [Paenibacillus albiflavus]|uniref:NUDIX hydrolase n=1 Tax=Paenibacillus albiflavus TaxID=2545760 RepID=A0A4R4EDG5_9BACL|nr:NUDIX hydrolase [Paenibacillus albiflavus]TCZ77487.1 NUDIX hydrolase [Paenibacillus albiflavus]
MSLVKSDYEEVTISTKPIFNGKVISLQVDEVQLPNGQTATRELVKHPGAVAVIALVDDRMIFVDQFRKPLERMQVEIPAGKLDSGEEPLEAARRELEEETGYACESLSHVCSFYTSPGFADEILHIYVAEGLKQVGELKLDEDEFLDCLLLTFEDAQRLIQEQRISDSKTIFAVYAWQIYRLTGKWS